MIKKKITNVLVVMVGTSGERAENGWIFRVAGMSDWSIPGNGNSFGAWQLCDGALDWSGAGDTYSEDTLSGNESAGRTDWFAIFRGAHASF